MHSLFPESEGEHTNQLFILAQFATETKHQKG